MDVEDDEEAGRQDADQQSQHEGPFGREAEDEKAADGATRTRRCCSGRAFSPVAHRGVDGPAVPGMGRRGLHVLAAFTEGETVTRLPCVRPDRLISLTGSLEVALGTPPGPPRTTRPASSGVHRGWGRRDSNPHWRRFKRPASTDWATSPQGIFAGGAIGGQVNRAAHSSPTTQALRCEELARLRRQDRTTWWRDPRDPMVATDRLRRQTVHRF